VACGLGICINREPKVDQITKKNDMGSRRQGTYWLGTISLDQLWEPCLPDCCYYLKGQRELGEGGFEHWQIFFITRSKESIRSLASK